MAAAAKRTARRLILLRSDPLGVRGRKSGENRAWADESCVCMCIYARGVVCRAQALGNLVLNGGKVSVWECGVGT